MKNKSCKERTVNSACIRGSHVVVYGPDKNSTKVSSSREAKWAELTKQVVHENIGAWKTLSKE
jgi:hypothetical protein